MRFPFLFLLSIGCSLFLSAQAGVVDNFTLGSYSENITYDEQHRPVEIIVSREGNIEETLHYTYQSDRIFVSTEGIDGAGHGYIWKDTLYLREDGSLRKMERVGQGSAPSLGWDRNSGWISHDAFSEIVIYNEQGRYERRTVYNEKTPEEEEIFTYSHDGDLVGRILYNYLLDEVGETDYLPGELVKEQRLYRGGLLVSQTKYTYNEEGKPVEKITLGRGRTESWTGLYGRDGQLLEEKYFFDGLLARIVNYGESGKTEEIYNKGRLSLKIYYQNGEIVDEEKFD